MRSVTFPAVDGPRASVIVLAWRQREHLLDCLEALSISAGTRVPYEVVLVFNGGDVAVRDAVRDGVSGVALVSAEANLGFAGGCHRGVQAARGEYLVLLNDDALVEPGWLDWLVATADANPSAGAVGSAVCFPDGRLQEVGSVVWRDGSTMPVGRGLAGNSLEWHFVRQVDYASACSLLVRRSTWSAVGGMDEGYHPAYYEDVDLCLAIRAHGQQVLVEPRSRVRHHESASTSGELKRFLFARHRRRLVDKWAAALAWQEPRGDGGAAPIVRAVWRARGAPRRVLVVDDRVPDQAVGSGFGRMADLVIELARAGFAVSLCPRKGASASTDPLVASGIAIVTGRVEEHLARPEVLYDAVIVSRPKNFEYVASLVRRHQPWATLVYDCEALFWRRSQRRMELADTAEEARRLAAETAALRRLEERIVVESDYAIAVSTEEAPLLTAVPGHCPVEVVLPAAPRVTVTEASFWERQDLAFVAGWMAGRTSPNADGFRWLMREVFPEVRAALPWVRVRVTGARPPADLLALADPNVLFEGRIPDLAALYGAVRVAVSPARYGAGVKVKTIEALQHGVPIVCTTVGAEGIDTHGHEALDVTDDPVEFARRLIVLLTDAQAWERRRAAIAALLEAWGPGDALGASAPVVRRALARRRHA